MMTLEQATQRALAERSNVNQCHEYADAFVFSRADDMSFGGWDEAPIIVMKDDGSIRFGHASFVEEDHEFIRTIPIKGSLRNFVKIS